MSINTYNPDYAIHPGEILAETIEARNIEKQDIAKRCDLSTKTISEIINGKTGITPATSLSLEKVLGVSANIWNNLDANYRLFEARKQKEREKEHLINWARMFPTHELMKRGLLTKTNGVTLQTADELLRLFRVTSPSAWEKTYKHYSDAVMCRKSERFETSIESIITWIVLGVREAEQIETEPYSKIVFLENIKKIREMTVFSPEYFEPQIKELCRLAGVAVVFIQEFPKTHICGATKWLSSKKALIVMSLRYKTDDQFWFTFFHEAAHILLHGRKDIFIYQEGVNITDKENKANEFASNILIHGKQYKRFISKQDFSIEAIRAFAKSINITPGVVAGRLQHDKLVAYSNLNQLKQHFEMTR